MQQGGFYTEALSQPRDELRCESDLGRLYEDLRALIDDVAHAMQIELGLAAARDPLDKVRGKPGAGSQCRHGRLLRLVLIGSRLGFRCKGFVEVCATLLEASYQSSLE